MPITLKIAQMKYKDEHGDYVPINAVGDGTVAEYIEGWLDDHPEATTSVQDNSLTVDKLVVGTLDYVTPQMFGAVADGTTDDTQAIQAAVDSGYSVFFPEGTYKISSPIGLSTQTTLAGVGNRKSIIKITTNIAAITIADSVEEPYFLSGTSIFELGFVSTGGTYGRNAVGYGIKFGNPAATSALANIPRVKIFNCSFSGFGVGIHIEGYGHMISGTYFANCLTGIELIHAEQVLMDGDWIEYCDTGLRINNTKQHYGHNFQLYSGAIQRCNYGAKIYNMYEVFINTYCELNNVLDFDFGDSADSSNYTKGCKNVHLTYNTTGEMSGNTETRQRCVGLFATVGVDIDIYNTSSYAGNNTPNVFANGYSKYIRIYSHSENIGQSSTPYSINSNASQSTIIYLDGNQQYTPTASDTYKVQYSAGVTTPFAIDKIAFEDGAYRNVTSYTDSGKNIHLSRGSHSSVGVIDDSNGSTMFEVRNNPTETYRRVYFGIPFDIKDSHTGSSVTFRVYDKILQVYSGGGWIGVTDVVDASNSGKHYALRINNGVLQYFTGTAWANVKADSAT